MRSPEAEEPMMRSYEVEGDTLVESDTCAARRAREAHEASEAPTGLVVVSHDDGTIELRVYGRNDDLAWDADPPVPVVADPAYRDALHGGHN